MVDDEVDLDDSRPVIRRTNEDEAEGECYMRQNVDERRGGWG